MIDRMIERLRQRDETVLNDIKDQYGDVCFKTAYSMLKNKEDAEEVVSDTLFAVWNRRAGTQPKLWKKRLPPCVFSVNAVKNCRILRCKVLCAGCE